MEIRVSGHQMDTGDALRTHVSDRMNLIADKYFSRAIGAHAIFGKSPHDKFQCDIKAHVMQGLILKGHGEAKDAHSAFENAATRIEKQLRRYMRRLKNHHNQPHYSGAEHLAAPPPPKAVSIDDIEDNASYTIFAADEAEEEVADAPLIVAETRVDIPEASVSDAVMMLDLRDTNALMFVNSKSGAHNMVYRRKDGTIGWVEPR